MTSGTLFEKYETNKCPLKFVTKLVRNPGRSDCVERFSGRLLKVSNWKSCEEGYIETLSGRKMVPKVHLSKCPTLVVGRSLRTCQRGLNDELSSKTT